MKLGLIINDFTHLTHGLEIVASLATLEKLPGQL